MGKTTSVLDDGQPADETYLKYLRSVSLILVFPPVAKLAAAAAGQQALQATAGLVPAEVHEQFDRWLGRLARFPVGPDQLAGYLLRHVERYGGGPE